eukprot:COSAG01_NODE_56988_length_315_cov_0.712963_2_plen_26_part_01
MVATPLSEGLLLGGDVAELAGTVLMT